MARPAGGVAAERRRLEEIAALDLLSPSIEEELSDIVEATAARFDVPISLVTLVLDSAQCFVASYGLSGWLDEAKGTPIEWSFCAHPVRNGRAFVIADAAAHPGWKDNPLVLFDAIRCYAGVPLITSRGVPIGTLCVMGPSSRHFDEAELEDLQELAGEVVRRIEHRAAAAGS